MLLHLPRRSVTAASVHLILPDSWKHSALPPAQLCKRENSSVLSDDKSALEEPPSDRRSALWEIVCP